MSDKNTEVKDNGVSKEATKSSTEKPKPKNMKSTSLIDKDGKFDINKLVMLGRTRAKGAQIAKVGKGGSRRNYSDLSKNIWKTAKSNPRLVGLKVSESETIPLVSPNNGKEGYLTIEESKLALAWLKSQSSRVLRQLATK